MPGTKACVFSVTDLLDYYRRPPPCCRPATSLYHTTDRQSPRIRVNHIASHYPAINPTSITSDNISLPTPDVQGPRHSETIHGRRRVCSTWVHSLAADDVGKPRDTNLAADLTILLDVSRDFICAQKRPTVSRYVTLPGSRLLQPHVSLSSSKCPQRMRITRWFRAALPSSVISHFGTPTLRNLGAPSLLTRDIRVVYSPTGC